jgi:hypothetical protein
LPGCDKTVEALKYLKDNKEAGSNSITVELLKNGGQSLMNALNNMTQQIWIGKILPENWEEGK